MRRIIKYNELENLIKLNFGGCVNLGGYILFLQRVDMRKLLITRKVPKKEHLKKLYKLEKDSRLKERYHALWLMHEFENAREVANLLGRSKMTILTWIKAFNHQGRKGLLRKLPPGRQSRLSEAQKEGLKEDILTNPREFGYNFSNWEGKSVAFHLLKKFGVHLGVRAVQKLLHKLGFSLQRPRHKLKKADPEAQEAFRHDLKKKWRLSDQMTSCYSKMNVV